MKKEKRKPLFKLMYERKKAGLTQSELAEKVGCMRMTIYYYESGARVPNAEMLSKLATALNCKTEDIV